MEIALGLWIVSGIAAALVGAQREAGCLAAAIVFALGPIGLVVAFALDGRPRCPRCGSGVPEHATSCSRCHARFAWAAGRPRLAEYAQADAERDKEIWRRANAVPGLDDVREQQAAAELEQLAEEEAARSKRPLR